MSASKPKNKAAAELGKLGKDKKKTMSPAAIEQRTANSRAIAAKRAAKKAAVKAPTKVVNKWKWGKAKDNDQ